MIETFAIDRYDTWRPWIRVQAATLAEAVALWRSVVHEGSPWPHVRTAYRVEVASWRDR